MNNNTTYILKAMLVLAGIAFYAPGKAQNILANPDFDKEVVCCEFRKKDLSGWLYVGSYHARRTIDKKHYLTVGCFNKANSYNGITIGRLVKPAGKSQTYLLKIRLRDKKTFYLHYRLSKELPYRHYKDTTPFFDSTFQRVFINNQKEIHLEIQPGQDSCNYIEFKFEDVQQEFFKTTHLLIDYIRLIDKTETEQSILSKYYQTIIRIESDTQKHDWENLCGSDHTLYRSEEE